MICEQFFELKRPSRRRKDHCLMAPPADLLTCSRLESSHTARDRKYRHADAKYSRVRLERQCKSNFVTATQLLDITFISSFRLKWSTRLQFRANTNKPIYFRIRKTNCTTSKHSSPYSSYLCFPWLHEIHFCGCIWDWTQIMEENYYEYL